nr:hypothetical protein [Tanacetum cinerariifolium]
MSRGMDLRMRRALLLLYPKPLHLMYPEYLAPSDDEAPLEHQPLPTDASPIAASLDYVADSDPNEDPEENPEDDQADYPANERDGDDEPFDDDDDDTDSDLDEDPKKEPFEEEEEEHLAPVDPSAIPIVDHVLSAGDTEVLEADEPTPIPRSPIIIPLSQTRLHRARKTVRPEPPMSASMEACIARHVHLPSPPLLAGYRITDTWDEIVDTLMKIALTTLEGVDQRVTELDTTIRYRTDEFEIRFEEVQDDRALLRARVNTLLRDRPDHRRTTMRMDREAMYAREAWAYSEDRSSAIAAHVRTLKA